MSDETVSMGKYLPLVLAVAFTSFCSLLASIAVVRIAHLRLGATYQRFLFMISVSSIVNSTFLILHPFLVPDDPAYPWAGGSEQTCKMVGFFFHFGAMMISLYNCMLSVYFYFSIQSSPKMQKEPEDIVGWPETLSHLSCWLVPAGIAAAAAATKNINFDERIGLCVITGDTFTADILGYMFAGLVLFSLFVSSMLTFIVFTRVRSTLIRGREPGTDAAVDDETKQRLQAVSSQAVLYTVAFVHAILWPAVLTILPDDISENVYFIFQLLAYLMYPFHGVLSCCIYIRPRFQMLSVMYPDDSYIVVARVALSMAGDPEEIENVRAIIYGSDYESPSGDDSEEMSMASSLPQEVSFDPNRPLSETSMVSSPDESDHPESDNEEGSKEADATADVEKHSTEEKEET